MQKRIQRARVRIRVRREISRDHMLKQLSLFTEFATVKELSFTTLTCHHVSLIYLRIDQEMRIYITTNNNDNNNPP